MFTIYQKTTSREQKIDHTDIKFIHKMDAQRMFYQNHTKIS